MPELIELIKEYGRKMYDAGIQEREEKHQRLLNEADKLLDTLEFLSQQADPADAIPVPCAACTKTVDSKPNWCHNCGRDLRC